LPKQRVASEITLRARVRRVCLAGLIDTSVDPTMHQ
jgi:hypothetical protein